MNTLVRIAYKTVFILLLPIIMPLGYYWAKKRNEADDYYERFGFIKLPRNLGPSVWFHCASVGEVRSIAGLVSHLRAASPGTHIIVSTMTHTGKQVALQEIKPEAAFLLPFENGTAVKHIIRVCDVRAFVVVDTELWPSIIAAAKTLVPLFLINGRISAKSYTTYKKGAFFFRGVIRAFTTIYAKSTLDAERFASIKGSSDGIVPLGNLKYIDRIDPDTVEPCTALAGKKLFLAASTHEPEEQIAINAFKRTREHVDHLVIAPRHLTRVSRAVMLAEEAGLSVALLSDIAAGAPAADVVVVDAFGRLNTFFKSAHRVFVGGSIAPIGGHNIFESLQFETPVAVGPHMENFHDLASMAQTFSVTRKVHDAGDLADFIISGIDGEPDFAGFFTEIGTAATSRRQTITDAITNAIRRTAPHG